MSHVVLNVAQGHFALVVFSEGEGNRMERSGFARPFLARPRPAGKAHLLDGDSIRLGADYDAWFDVDGSVRCHGGGDVVLWWESLIAHFFAMENPE